ncbi:neuroblast differentiation-associated protein AHNAK-like [Phyllopteryx taeniolatus]|uniref:neuroblast differentiation-associated protein AHNAK-like n=1 Tax=Phyllopteryx taeniolatus TaxID=161469 RepID=UPI002AD293F4|nr:neuroblast differentiation-associated protein AHNAK-like [Phyllopteryx taeniolatus]
MCDCFHLAFPHWHGAPSGTGVGRRLRAPDLGSEDHSACDEPSHFTEGERPRPQGSSPVEEHPETEKYSDSDKEEDDPHHKRGRGKKAKKSGFACGFDRRSTPKMSKLKEAYSPDSGMIVKTAKDGGAEGLVYGGGGKEGIFIKEVVPESPASKSLQLKEGDQLLSATVYFDNVSYQDAIQILEHAQAYKVKLCLKRKPDITETEPLAESDIIPEDEPFTPEMREHGKSKRRGDARISWPKFPSLGRGKKSRFARSHSSSEADEQRKLELSPTTSDTESPIKTQDALKGKKRHKMKLPSLTKRGRISSSEDQDTDAPTTCTQEVEELLSPEVLQSRVGGRPEVHRMEEMTLVEGSDSRVTKPLAIQHRVDLIAIDSALKTTDLTVALAGQESPTGPLSPDGKKKKKERSELKLKMLGKDKSHKKEAKAKSPKRLKTLGASLDIADQGIIKGDQPEHMTQIEQASPLKGKSKTKNRTLLPKREDIEIPGMEDMSVRTNVKGLHDELPETVQLSIDVDSVKEAVSKLPGYKLPKVDMCGVPIPEEITVIDANAQRISVKTPTKVADSKTKQETPISTAEDTSTTELSKTSFKLPKINPGDLTSEEIVTVTRVDQTTTETTQECEPALNSKESDKKSKTTKIVFPSIGLSKSDFKIPDIGMYFPKPNISGPKDDEVKGERTIFLKEEISEGGIVSDAKMHETEISIGELEYIDSAESPVKKELDGKGSPFQILKFDVSLPKLRGPEIDLSLSKTDGKVKSPDAQLGAYKNIPEEKQPVDTAGSPIDQEAKGWKFKMPQFHFTMPEITEPQLNVNVIKKDVGVKKTEPESETQLPVASDMDLSPGIAQATPRKDKKPECLLSGVKLDGHETKFPITKFKVKGPDIDFGLSKEGGDAAVPEAKVDSNIDIPGKDLVVNISAPRVNIEGSVTDTKIPDAEQDGKGGRFKMPHLRLSMPKVKGDKTHADLSKKGTGVTTPEAKVDVCMPDTPKIDSSEAKAGVKLPTAPLVAVEIKSPECEADMDGQGMKLKMPKMGVRTPKVKGPDIELNLTKKDVDVNLLDTRNGGKIPEMPQIGVNIRQSNDFQTDIDIEKPELQMQALKFDVEDREKLKTLKTSVDITQPDVPKVDLGKVNIGIAEAKIEEPEIDTETLYAEIEHKGGKFKMPKFGISLPKVKGPEIDLTIAKKEVTLPEAKAEVKIPSEKQKELSVEGDIKTPKNNIMAKETTSPTKFWRPIFKLPKFGIVSPTLSEEVPDGDRDVKIDGFDDNIPEEVLAVSIEPPGIDISLSKKDGEIRLPEDEVELTAVELKLPSAKVEMEGPKIEAQTSNLGGSPSKFKLPTVKFPKFSLTNQSSKDSELEIGLPDADISIPVGKLEVTQPKVEFEAPEVDVKIDNQECKFKMSKPGISVPKMKRPEIDLSSSNELTVVEMKLPSAKVEIETPKIETQPGGVEGSPSKFKLPTLKLPKLGVALPQVNVEVDKDVKMEGADLKPPEIKVEAEVPDTATDVDVKVKRSRVSFPKFSLNKQSSKESEVGISVPGVDVSVPEGKLEITSPKLEFQPPDVDVNIDGQEGKYKMTKFGISMPKVKSPDIDISLPKKEGEIRLPEAEVELTDVRMDLPSAKVEIEGPKIEAQPGCVEGSPSKFKLPTFKLPKLGVALPQVSVEVPDMDKEIKVDGATVKSPEILVEAKLPDAAADVDVKLKKSRFSFPKFSLTKQSSKESEFDINLPDVDVSVPEGKLELTSPKVEFQPPEIDVNIDGQEGKYKMPKFGISMPNVKGPAIDISLSKKDGGLRLPEAEVELTDIEMKLPSAQVEIEGPKIETQPGSVDGSPSKFKLPTFKLPKLGVALPQVSVEVPDMDKEIKVDGATVKSPELLVEAKLPDAAADVDVKVKKSRFSFPKFSLTKQSSKESEFDMDLPHVDVSLPEGKLEITSPKVEFQPPEVDVNIDGQEGKYKMPKFGISMPNVKGPDIDISLSKKDGGLRLPEAEVELTDIEMKLPSAQVEIEGPKIEAQPGSVDGSPSKFKLPTFKLPKFGLALPQVSVEVPDMDKEIKVDGATVKSPELLVEAKLPDAVADVDVKVKKSRFSFPKFSLTKQSSKESEVDISVPGVDVSVPEGKLEITSPKVEFQPPEVDVNIDGQEGKYKLPKFGISMPNVKGPDLDISFSKKDGGLRLPEAEVELTDIEMKLPSAQVEIEGPKIEVQPGSVDGSPSKFKLPTFKLPKLGVALPQVSVEVPDMDKEIKVDGATVKSPELLVEAKLPDAAADVDVKLKKSRFSFPKFSLTKQSSKESEFDIDLPDVDVSVPEGKLEITSPKVEFQPPDVDVNIDGQEGKYKMPKFGISMPNVKGPDIDLSFSRKDGGLRLPEAEVELTDIEMKLPSAQVEIEGPKIEAQPGSVDGSPSKFKLPTFKLPKFGLALQQVSVEVPDMDKEIKVDGATVKSPELLVEAKLPDAAADVDVKLKKSRFSFPKFSLTKQSSKESEFDINLPDVDVSVPEGKLELTSPKVEFQPPEIDVNIDGQEGKYKMPKFGISMPNVKGPAIDISLSKKDGGLRLPEAEVELTDIEMKLPSAQVEIEGPKIETQPGSVDGSPSKFKLPTFKLPKLGVALPQVSVEVPDMDKEIKVDGATVKSPELLVEAKLPDAAADVDVKVKKSRFSFPKFSLTKQSSKESEFDMDLPHVDVSLPEGKLEITSPKVEFQPPEVDVNIDGQEGKYKMPKFGISMPNVKGPDIDISLSKKDGGLRLPEAEVELTDIEMKLPSAQVEIEGPKIEAQPGSVDGSPSKFKLPTFKLPKFGLALPQVSVEVPDMDKEIKVDGATVKSPELLVEAKLPDAVADVDVKVKKSRFSFPKFSLTKQSSKESEVDISVPGVDVSVPEGKLEITSPKVEFQPPEVDVNIDGQEGKYKLPKFGISMPNVKGPDLDISFSKKDGGLRLPEAEVELTDIEMKLPSAQVEIEGPKIEVQPGSVDGSPSKFKLPTFKLPKLGVALPQVSVEVPDMDKEIKVDGATVKSPELLVEAKLPDAAADVDVKLKKSRFSFPKFSLTKQSSKESEFDIDLPDVDVSVPEGKLEITSPKVEFQPPDVDVNIDGQEGKYKMPKFGISMPNVKGPDIDLSFSRKDGGLRLPEAEVELTDIEMKLPSAQVEIEGPKIEAQPGSVDGSPSKFKLPTFKLPKFGLALPQVSVEVPDMDKEIKVDGATVKSPELLVEAKLPDAVADVDVKVKKSRFSFPKFSLTKQSSKESEVDISVPGVDVSVPEGKLEITSPKVEFQPPEVDVNIDGQEGKYKLPKFGISMPNVKGPDLDISFSKKDGGLRLPEAEVELTDIEMKLPSAQVEIEGPKIEVQPGSVDGSPSKFKLPTFKLPKLGVALPQVSVEVPDMDKEIKVDGATVKSPELLVEAKLPDAAADVDVKLKKSRFSFPKFSLTKQSSKESEFDIDLPDVDVSVPEGKLEITSPKVEFQPPDVDVNIDGQEGKYKMPKFGISMPNVKGPDIDIRLSKKDGGLRLPEAEVELTDIEMKLPSAQVEIEGPKIEAQPGSVDGSPSKFKLPTFKLPKFGLALPQVSVEVPDIDKEVKVDGATVKSPELLVEAKLPDAVADVDVKVKKSRFSFPKFSLTKQSSKESEVDISVPGVDVSVPEGKLEITSPKVEFQPPEVDVNIDGQEGKYKLPRFGISMPNVKGPDLDISFSKKDGGLRLPEAEVELTDIEMKLPSAQVEIEGPKIEVQPGSVDGSPSKFKLPTFKLPKLGVALPQVSVEVPDMDKEIKVDGATVKSPELLVEAKLPDAAADVDVKLKKSRFSFPKFSLTKQSSKESEFDIDLPDVDVSVPEGKLEITSPKVEFQPPEVDVNIDGQEGKYKMPKFGISMPNVKGADIDLSFSRKDGGLRLPEAEVELTDIEMKLPSAQVEIEGPKIEVQPGSVDGSPSKFKLPTFKLPKLGVGLPQVSVEVPDMDKEIKVDGANVKSPDLLVEAKLPDAAADVDVKVKKSRFLFPKFSLTKQSSKESEFDMDLPHVDVSVPGGKLEITSPKVEFQPPEVDVNIDGQEGKYKLPKFGISMPKVKSPDIDISLPKKEGEIRLPEAEVELTDVRMDLPSAKVEIEGPKIEAQPGCVEGSPSKFKLPTFKLPKLGVALPQVNVEVPDIDKHIKVDGADGKSSELKAEAKPPDPASDVDVDGQEGKYKMPKFGISMPKVKGRDTDTTLSKKDGEIGVPEAEVELTGVEMNLPSAKVEIDGPKIEAKPGSLEGSPSKFKLPTFKLPKLGVALPQVSVEVPDMDKDIKVDGVDVKSPELLVEAKLPDLAADVDVKVKKSRFSFPKFSLSKQSSKDPDVDVSTPEGKMEITSPKVEFQPPEVDLHLDGQESKSKFGISMPKVKGPDIDIRLLKKDGEMRLQEIEVELTDIEMKLPSSKVEIEAPKIEAQPRSVEGSPSKIKLTKVKFPKFGVSKPKFSVEVPDMDKDNLVGDVKIVVPEQEAAINVSSPTTDRGGISVDVKEGELEGSGSKFIMPKFGISMPKVKRPDIDIGISTQDGDIILPEAEGELTEVERTLPSSKVEPEDPKIEAQPGNDEKSASKFKLPTVKFPKFSLTKQSSKECEVEVALPDGDFSTPERNLEITLPQVEFQPPEVDVNIDEQESKFKMPKFGVSMPKVKGTDIDISLSKKNGGITLPNVEVQLPDAEMKLLSPKVELEGAKIDAKKSVVEGSTSKFKLPSLKLPKFGGSPSKVCVEVPDVEEDSEIDGIKMEIPEDDVTLVVSAPSIDTEDVSVEVKTEGGELEGPGIKLKPLPDVDAEIKLTDGEVEQLESTISAPEAPKVEFDVKMSKGMENDDVSPVSPSKFKLPSFKMPRLAFSRQKPEGKSVSPETEYKDNQPEIKTELNGDGKSPQATPTTFGVVLKKFEGEFDMAQTEQVEEHPDASEKEKDTKDKQAKQQATKTPERTGWFSFPTFGLSSPSAPAKTPQKDDEKDQKSPSGERELDISPTCSVQSSDAFADISSTVTSEYVSLPPSSPTKVTVKYSDPNLPPELGEMNVVTSTARSELITIEPDLPEKITILSSEVSSSSEETLRLASGKIHVFTSSVQAGSESQHTKVLSKVQSTSEASQISSSWTVESSQSSRTLSQKQIVRETSRESTETFVITKQITKMFEPAEFFGDDETASSIQRLRESVHSEKMRFFDGAEK